MHKLKGVPLETAIIERCRRRESNVGEALNEMYLAGVSVRRGEDIIEALWGTKVSPATISELKMEVSYSRKPPLRYLSNIVPVPLRTYVSWILYVEIYIAIVIRFRPSSLDLYKASSTFFIICSGATFPLISAIPTLTVTQ